MKKLWILMILVLAVTLVLSACAKEEEVTVVSISLSKDSLSSTYYVGDKLDLEATTIIVKYSDGSQRLVIVNESMISGFSTVTEGVGTMTIAYQGVATSFRYNVINNQDVITITQVQTSGIPTEYVKGDVFPNVSDFSMTVTFSNTRTEFIRGEYLTIDGFSTAKVGEYTMRVSGETTYGTAVAEIKYVVGEHKPATSFEVENFPGRIIQGDKTTDLFATTVIIPTYEDGTVGDAISLLDTSVKINYGANQTLRDKAFTVVGDFTLTITFSGAKKEIPYTVLQKYNDYNVTFNPNISGVSSTTEKTDNGKIEDLYSNFFVRKGYFIKYWYVTDKDNKQVRWNFEEDVFTQDTTLTAFWEKISYSITYVDVSDDSLNKKNNATYDVESQIILNTEYKTGYTFAGFYKNSIEEGNLLGTDGITLQAGTVGDMVLVAKWIPVAYSISYNYDYTNPTTCENPTTYTVVTAGVQFANPERLGYTFEGWQVESCDSDFWRVGDVYKGIDLGKAGNVKFKAVWKVIEYKINYVMPTGAAIPSLKSYKISDKDLYLDDGVQGNRFFRGWYLTEDFSQEFYKEKGSYVIKSGSHGDITLYPKFVKKYVFNFLFGDATPVWGKQTDSTVVIENNNQIAFGEDSETVILPEVERIYSQFTNWQYMGVDFAQQIKVAEFLSVPRDGYHFVLSPLWNNDKYTLTYNYGYQVYNDKSGEYEDKVETSEFDFYQTVDLPSKVLRTGYTFKGWVNDATGETLSSIREKTVHTNLFLTANWEIVEYSITKDYVRADYIPDELIPNTTSYTVESGVVLDNPTCDTHDFLGWYLASDIDGEAVSEIEKGSTGEVNLVAKWSIKVFKINYANVSPEELHLKTIYEFQCGTTTKINLYGATRDGYKFEDWYSDEALKQRVTYLDVSALREDVTVYAKWSLLSYTITYNNASGATNPNPKNYTIDDEVVLQPAVKNGYDFLGWFSKNGSSTGDWGEEVTQISKGSTGNVILYAQLVAGSYDLVYHLGYGDPEITETVQFTLAQAVVPYKPTRDHYKFIGWYIDENLSTLAPAKIGGSGYACKDENLYAAWDYVTYTIDFYPVLNGSLSQTAEKITFNIGDFTEDGYLLGDRPKLGYTFDGWFEDEALTKPITEILLAENCTLYGKYTPIKYRVIYNLDEGTNHSENPETITVSEVVTLKDASKEGFDFGGWYLDKDYNEQITVLSNQSEQVELFARYYKVYNVSYDYGYGQEVATNVVRYNETQTVALASPKNVTTGYTFWHWVEIVDEKVEVVTECVNKDYQLKALYYNSKTAGFDFIIENGKATVSSYTGSTTVSIPSLLGEYPITSLADSLFANTSVATVTIPEGITTIGANVFASTKIRTITIPDTVENMGHSAFKGATLLATVNLSQNDALSKIPDNCFNGCTALKTITIPDNYLTIGMSSFSGSGLTAISFQPTLVSINNNAFVNCTSLKTVTFQKDENGDTQITNLYDKAFANTGVTSFEIPMSVSYVGNGILSGCTSLAQITINGKHTVAHYFGTDYYDNSFEASIVIGGSIKVYRIPTALETVYFNSEVSEICDNCLASIGGAGYEGVSKVYLPDAVLSFGSTLHVEAGGYKYQLVATSENYDGYITANSSYADRFAQE